VLTYSQALERVRELHRKNGAGGGDAPHGPYTVKQAITDYLAGHLEGKASENDTRKRLAAYLPAKLADKEIAELGRDEIVAWHRGLAKMAPRVRTARGAATQKHREVDLSDPEILRARQVSANRILGLLKAALNFAITHGKASGDRAPWRSVLPFRGVASARVRYLTVAEAKRLINAADPELRTLVQAALLTGARYQEIARLKVEDFNPDAGTLLIRQSKSGKSRHVVLTEEGAAFFGQLSAGRPSSAPMLGREWKPSAQNRGVAAACARAGIDPAVGVHTLRHTWASLAIMANVPLMVVARNLGHADTRMVEKNYAHLAPSYVAEEIRRGAPRFGIAATKIRRLG
jgi:integrase